MPRVVASLQAGIRKEAAAQLRWNGRPGSQTENLI
jgi:hypothetical protein